MIINDNLRKRIIIFLLIVPLSTILFIVYGSNDINITFFLLIIFGVLVILPFFFLDDIFNPIIFFNFVSIFVWIHFYIKPTYDYTYFRYYTSYDVNDYVYPYSIFIIIVWYFFFYAGYLISNKIKLFSKINLGFNKKNFEFQNPNFLGVMLFLIGVSAFYYLTTTTGGILNLINGMGTRVELYAGKAYFVELVGLGGLSAIFFLIGGKKKTSFIVLVIFSVLISFLGGRGGLLLGTIVPYLIVYNYYVKKIRTILLFLFFVLSLFLFELLGVLRRFGEFSLESSGLIETILNAAIDRQRAETIPSIVGALHDGAINFQFGKPLMNIFFAPIPRSLWSDKPIIDESGVIGYALMGENAWGIPPGPYGWAYFNFSWLGVIIFALLTGIIVRKLYESFKSTSNVFFTVLYSQIYLVIFDVLATSGQINIITSVIFLLTLFLVDKLQKDNNNIKTKGIMTR